MLTKETKKEIGKFLIDIAKLVMGGVVLATILKSETLPKMYVLVVGVLVTGLLVTIGFDLINKSTK